MTDCNRYPTPEEMTALYAAAHRARARWMKVLLLRGLRAAKFSALRLTQAPVSRRVSHA